MDQVIQYLSKGVLGTELWRIISFFAVILLSLVLGRLSRFFIERGASRTKTAGRTGVSLLLSSVAKPAVLLAFTVGVWLGISMLGLDARYVALADTVTRVLYASAIGYALYRLVDVMDHYLLATSARTESKLDDMLVPMVGKSVRITIVVLVVLQIAQALSDKPLTAVVTSLGVGGLAIALAGQDTVKNFFGSMVILADKPFEIGDRIVVDGYDGPVEKVGFRSTRLRTLSGHLVTVPNGEMVNKTVENIGKRPYIKHVATIGVTYDTSPEKAKRAVAILKEILDNHEGMDAEFPPRVFFKSFGDFSLNIMMMFWYHPPEYWDYMAFAEKVNHEILARFNAEGIEFAFPSQTVYMANDDARQLGVRIIDKS